jgi:hypothetical protein
MTFRFPTSNSVADVLHGVDGYTLASLLPRLAMEKDTADFTKSFLVNISMQFHKTFSMPTHGLHYPASLAVLPPFAFALSKNARITVSYTFTSH